MAIKVTRMNVDDLPRALSYKEIQAYNAFWDRREEICSTQFGRAALAFFDLHRQIPVISDFANAVDDFFVFQLMSRDAYLHPELATSVRIQQDVRRLQKEGIIPHNLCSF